MFKLWFLFSITSLAIHFANSAKVDGDVPPITEDLPLILIKVKNDLVPPTNVEITEEKWYRKGGKIRFKWSNYDKQVFYCPAETPDQRNKITQAIRIYNNKPNKVESSVDDNCLFKKKKDKKIKARFPKCEQGQPQPRTMKELREKQTAEMNRNHDKLPEVEPVPCGQYEEEGQILIFGYQICDEYEGMDKYEYRYFHNKETVSPFRIRGINIYRICYSAQKKEILYTSHRIAAPLLLKDDLQLLEEERSKYPSDKMSTNKLMHISEINFEQVQLEFEKMEKSDKNPFKIQLLVPLKDFPFVTWKRPVFHYVNASLIHQELQSCWDAIHDRIRSNAIKTKRQFVIHTKALKSYEMAPLAKNKGINSILVPFIWVKLVHHTDPFLYIKKSLAIIANNFRNKFVDAIISNWLKCEPNLCSGITTNEYDVGTDIRCCKSTTEIQQLFGVKSTSHILLDIDGLIDADSGPNEKSATTSIN